MNYFAPEDTESSDGDHHKEARQLMTEPLHTTDDIPFKKQEIQAVLEKFDPWKTPGEDSLTAMYFFSPSGAYPSSSQKYTTNVYVEDTSQNYGRDP
jgi:hypothetical protein